MSKPAGVIIDEARHKAQELQSQRRHSQEFLNNARSRPSSLVLRGAFGGGVSEPAGTPARGRVAAPEQDDALAMVLERLLSLEARAPGTRCTCTCTPYIHMHMHLCHVHCRALRVSDGHPVGLLLAGAHRPSLFCDRDETWDRDEHRYQCPSTSSAGQASRGQGQGRSRVCGTTRWLDTYGYNG